MQYATVKSIYLLSIFLLFSFTNSGLYIYSRYPEGESSFTFYRWLFEKYDEVEGDGRVSLLNVLKDMLKSMSNARSSVYISPIMAKVCFATTLLLKILVVIVAVTLFR